MTAVAVIGCGHGGQTLAADLTQRGCRVTLFAHPEHTGGLNAIIKQKNQIHCKGLINGIVSLHKITTFVPEAIIDSEYIFICLPSYAHEAIFIQLLPFIKPGQTIITLAANFASLVLLKLLAKTNKLAGIDIIDMASLPYVCRANNQGSIEVLAIKHVLAAASIPAQKIKNHLKKLAPFFPCKLLAYDDVLSLSMNITNGIAHPVVTLLNSGRIGENKPAFYFYRDGITPAIATVIERLDEERMLIGKKLGLKMYSFLDLTAQYYGEQYVSIYQHFQESPAHNALPMCPASLQHRFILEDIAGSLVTWYCLGKLLEIKSAVLENIISLASLLNNTDYLRTGANLFHINLHDKSLEEIKKYVRYGELPSGLSRLSNRPFKQFKHIFSFGDLV